MWKFKRKEKPNYENRISDTKYKVLSEALASILITDVKKKTADGTEVSDLGMTVSAMRMKARIALDFVNNLKDEAVNK
jgi:hypothetical protein